MKDYMEKNNIKVSILVSTYNWPEALSLCMESIFRQTILPDEIVIADDGSGEETLNLIKKLQKESKIPIKHVWQEDKGFRKTLILNKAIAQITGDYVLQVDGDVYLTKNFVHDHLEMAEENRFVCGSRIRLSEKLSKEIIKNNKFSVSFFKLPIGFALNSLRSKTLRKFMAKHYGTGLTHLRGCNMAFWLKDLIKVNGFNEDFIEWGHEDLEIAYRLHFAGVRKKMLKMGGAVFHIHHKENSKKNELNNLKVLAKIKQEHATYCKNGLDKYLQ